MKLFSALAVAGILAFGTVTSAALTASHQTPANTAQPSREWTVPSSVAPVPLMPSDNIAPDRSYSVQDAPQPRCEEDQPCWDCHTMGNGICGTVETPETVAPAYVPPAPVYVVGTPKPTVTVQGVPVPSTTPVATPTPSKAVATPSAVPTIKPTPGTTCPPLLHKDGLNIAPKDAPAGCVYAQ